MCDLEADFRAVFIDAKQAGITGATTALATVPDMNTSRCRSAAIALLAVPFVIGACGSSGGSPTGDATTTTVAPTPPTTNAEVTTIVSSTAAAPPLEAAVRSYTAAFLGGNVQAAYDLLSERCRNEMARNAFTRVVEQAAGAYGNATITSYKETVRGNVGTATYSLTVPSLNQTEERWVLDGSAWHNDDC
jgi:hypothetical protein